jgi:hypothetical protein
MKAKDLLPGLQVYVIDGVFIGKSATITDPTVQPDNTHNARKVAVAISGVGVGGTDFDTYVLPRQLSLHPPMTHSHTQAHAMPQPSAVPTPTITPPPLPAPAPLASANADLTFISAGSVQEAEPITDPMDPSLDRFRPDPDIVARYVSRNIKGGYIDTEYFLHLREERVNGYSPNVAMVGGTQSGKTMFVQVLAVLAAQADGLPKPYPVFTLNGSTGITSYDLFGQTTAVIIDGRETLVWMNGQVPLAANCGGILYLDEWNAVPPSQAIALHPLMDDRRSFTNYQNAVPDGHGGFAPETIQANTSMWIISTINPGYKGTTTMAEASTNRFRWVPWDYDSTTEEALIPSSTVRALGNALREAHAQRVLSTPIGTSALQRFNSDCAAFGVDNALWVLSAMFPPTESERVKAIIEDRGIYDILVAEYPEPTHQPTTTTTPTTDDSDMEPF